MPFNEKIVLAAAAVLTIIVIIIIFKIKYKKLEKEVLGVLGHYSLSIVSYYDALTTVKSRQTLENYDLVKYFKENGNRLPEAERKLREKTILSQKFQDFLNAGEYEKRYGYKKIKAKINEAIYNAAAFRVRVDYISSAGNNLARKELSATQYELNRFRNDPSLLMSKGEYNKLLKEKQKEELDKKHHEFYDKVNAVVDYATGNKDSLLIKDKQDKVDELISQLFDRTVNSIQKVKTLDSEEWSIIDKYISDKDKELKTIVSDNKRLLDYYASNDFANIKSTCSAMMASQKDFNEYISEKAQSISSLFGTRVIRNETVTEDERNYIRPYKKTVTPFTAEVSSAVFASAENNPMEYIVKYFYPNKSMYPTQIRKLQYLVEELETLRDAKEILDNYKKDYQEYIRNVPAFVLENDEAGFYSRLGFAYIDESILTVQYKFSYTSNGGFAQRSFTIPMTEENIGELVKLLESKLTAAALAKEQRVLMTRKLREHIKERDNFTCRMCGNSTHSEPNLLLEIDHIIPVAKGGMTEENNLQTLCWKCNRSKGAKILT